VKSEENSEAYGNIFQDFPKKVDTKFQQMRLVFYQGQSSCYFFDQKKKLRQYLPQLLTRKCCKQTIIDEIVDGDNVQFQWCLISTLVEDATASHELFVMIVEVWLTIQGFSHTGAYPRVL